MERESGWVEKDAIGVDQSCRTAEAVYMEEIPANAIRSRGISTTGFNLLLSQDFPAIENHQMYEIILIPVDGFPKPPQAG